MSEHPPSRLPRSTPSAAISSLANLDPHQTLARSAASPKPNSGFVVTSRHNVYLPALDSESTPLRSRRNSPPSLLPASEEAKTTRTLSASVDSQGRRMVNQYVRLKTIGQGSHGKVWLCAAPTDLNSNPETYASTPPELLPDGQVELFAIKSVARDGPSRGKSLRAAHYKRNEGFLGIGADDKVKREVAIMKQLHHRNVVKLREVIDDAKSKKVFMVLEFMAGGQITWQDDNRCPTMTVEEARRTFRDVVLGLEYLHYQGIIHRDIKPANLLWTEDHSIVKISDFGVSHVSDALIRVTPGEQPKEDDFALRTTAGTPAFFAPELCHPVEYNITPRDSTDTLEYFGCKNERISEFSPPGTPNTLKSEAVFISKPLPPPDMSLPRTRPPIGKGIDIWALGVTLYCLLFGDTPFKAKTEYELYDVIVKQAVRVPERMGRESVWTGVGPGWEGCGNGEEGREAIDLLGKLLEKDPRKRITLEGVKTHPWVLRGLEVPAASWLDNTDISRENTVQITDEDLQHATQSRDTGENDLRSRPGFRNIINAALAKIPLFSRLGGASRKGSFRNLGAPGSNGLVRERERSKSISSTSVSEAPSQILSRQPSDATSYTKSYSRKTSKEGSNLGDFEPELKKIMDGGGQQPCARHFGGGRPLERTKSPLSTPFKTTMHISSDTACRSDHSSPGFAALSRTTSTSSAGKKWIAGSYKSSEFLANRSDSPALTSDDGRRRLSKFVSKFHRASSNKSRRTGDSSEDDSHSPSVWTMEEHPPLSSNRRNSAQVVSPSGFSRSLGLCTQYVGDSSDCYSDASDDEELDEAPIAKGDHITGWKSTLDSYRFGEFPTVKDAMFDYVDEDLELHHPNLNMGSATPKAIESDATTVNYKVPHDLSDSSMRFTPNGSHGGSSSVEESNPEDYGCDGAIKQEVPGMPTFKPPYMHEDEDHYDPDEVEIVVSPRRRRAPTIGQ